MCRKPKSEKRAPLLVATEFTTSWSPRVTSTSVTVSARDSRFEIASRWVWLLVQTLATSAYGSSFSDPCRIGPATSIESSKASLWMMLTGALSKRASRRASWARAATSISSANRPMTSPKVQISSSL